MTNFWTTLRKPILALAPMEGVTDVAFRTLCKEWGADVVYTEFLAAEAIVHAGPKFMRKMVRRDDERPVICQIFGRNPEAFALAAKKVEALGFDGLDINFGCPARKVVGHGAGVALLRDPQYARRLIEAALENITIPLSIKVRTSIRKEAKEVDPGCADRYTAVDFIEAMKDLPIQAVMVHGRGFEQGHQGDVDTDMIRQVKQKFNGLVLANGGVFTPERVASMLQETGADGVGIARGTWGQPWIFTQARQLLSAGRYEAVTPEQVSNVIRRHAELLFEYKGVQGLLEFRKHFGNYIKGFRGAAEWRARAVRVKTMADVETVIAAVVHREQIITA